MMIDFQPIEFRNHYHEANVSLIQTYNWVKAQVKTILESFGVTQQQFSILLILKENKGKPLSTIDLRDKMLFKMSDTSRIVARMERNGWVNKTISTDDKRRVEVVITKDGSDLLAAIEEKNDEIDYILDNISVSEAKTLNALLSKIRNGAN